MLKYFAIIIKIKYIKGKYINLSQEKREKLLQTIRNLRDKNSDNEIISDLNEIELEPNNKRYGLIWEKYEE